MFPRWLCIMAMHHCYVSWLCIIAMYYGYVPWLCITPMYHGNVSWLCIMAMFIILYIYTLCIIKTIAANPRRSFFEKNLKSCFDSGFRIYVKFCEDSPKNRWFSSSYGQNKFRIEFRSQWHYIWLVYWYFAGGIRRPWGSAIYFISCESKVACKLSKKVQNGFN